MAPERRDQFLKGGKDLLIPLSQQRGEDVLADLLAPQVVGTVAPRQVGGVEVHPVGVLAAGDAESARTNALGPEPEATLQAIEIDADALDVDGGFGHGKLLRDHTQI